MIANPQILAAIEAHAPKIRVPAGVELHPHALLAAITWPESRWGEIWETGRLEEEYYRGGYFYRRAEHVRKLVARYEHLAAMSYGCWHVMFVVAWELGYRGHPWELLDPAIGAPWVVAYLNERTFRQWDGAPAHRLVEVAHTVEGIGDSYNTGSQKDAVRNLQYEADLRWAYGEALPFWTARLAGAGSEVTT